MSRFHESLGLQLLRAAVPRALKSSIKAAAASVMFPTTEMPHTRIGAEHVKGGEVLADRVSLIQRMDPNGVVAELGVDGGEFSHQILRNSHPKKLHLVDTWSSNRYHEGKLRHVERRFATEISGGTIEINRGLSIDACVDFADEYFDWIYIDTSHSYRTTINELYAYERTVKQKGYICGHDYVVGNWSGGVRYGVIEAVAEFCVRRDWRIAYWTADYTESNSFALTRM